LRFLAGLFWLERFFSVLSHDVFVPPYVIIWEK